MAQKMINEQMVTRNGQKGFLDDKGNFYPIADMPADDAKVTPSNTADQSGGLGSPDVQPRTSANANRDGSRPGGGMTDAQIKAAQDKANADRKAQQQRGSYNSNPTTTPAPTPTPTPTPTSDLKIIRNKDGTVATKYTKNSAGDTPMQQWAKNFPKLAAKVKPGKAGYKEIRSVSNPATAATGGVNPRLGTYAMMQQANMNNLMSNYGRSKQPILPVSQRTMKKEAYDVVLDYLLSEGHVDTVEEAHYVMLQMTSEHVQEVVEAYVVTLADKKGNTKAYQNYKSGMKNKITGEPLYKAAPHLKGV